MSFTESIKFGFKKAGKFLSAKSPTILVVGGTIGLITAGVIACRQTAKELNKVLDEHKTEVAAIKDIRDGHVVLNDISTEEYAATKYKKHLTHVYLRTACKFAKVYAPALILAILSTAAILTGHKIITTRHLAAVAKCYSLEEAFSEYRKAVRGKIGEEEERLLYLGGEKGLITDKVKDEVTGEEKEKSSEGLVGPMTKRPYTYIASPDTMTEYGMTISDAEFRKQMQIKERNANQYFENHGQVFLSDIMRHQWSDAYMAKNAEVFTDGWLSDNPFVSETSVHPITIDVKLISGPQEPRKYAVTFNAQGDIVNAMNAKKSQDKAQERIEKKLKRKVKASIRPALA